MDEKKLVNEYVELDLPDKEVSGISSLKSWVKSLLAMRIIMTKILDRILIEDPRPKTQDSRYHVEGTSTPQLLSCVSRLVSCVFLPLFVASLLLSLTASAWGATIFGKVEIEGREDMSGVLVTVQGESLSAVTSRDGTYSILNVGTGSFNIIAQKPGCLVEVYPDVIVGDGSVEVDFEMIPGDLKIDNQINLLDRIMLTSVWGAREGDPNWNSMFDIHEDGVIDSKDKELLLSHWRKSRSIKLGALEVSSSPSGANILINGADTGKTTPHTFYGMVVGKYVITLVVENYAPGMAEVQIKPDETATIDQILDDQPPEFVNWVQDPVDLNEDTQGRFRVLVSVVDKGGSGLTGKIPQFDYHIGADNAYSGYEDMTLESGDIWYFDIPEPVESWNTYRGKYVYYKARVEDVAGNLGESKEQQELIDDINDPPTVRIRTAFRTWENGLLTMEAEASDSDGEISSVRFEYSFDNARWTQIGLTDTTPPYSVAWDTTAIEQKVVENVWIRATATDNDNASVIHSTTTSFAIDNEPPVTTHDYDGLWHNRDFVITLRANDGNGIGISRIVYILNNGNKQEIEIDGSQASASVDITTENDSNILEFWSLDKLGNEESLKVLSSIKLDRTAPVFSDWRQDPADLTEDTFGRFRVSVRVTDENGSGLQGKTPQLDYHIGTGTQYDGYESMVTEDGRSWNFDIPEPLETWNAHRGENLYYKVRVEDVAGNPGDSIERRELIDDINDPPTISITSRFNPYEKGLLAIVAESSDPDGTIVGVQFEYSSDQNVWIPIGPPDTSEPFFVEWDTTASIPQAQKVWIRATTTDDGGTSVTDTYPASIGIDNQPPTTTDDYDGLWHTMDFAIILKTEDGNGIGVSITNTRYILNDGSEKNLSTDGHPWVTQEGTNQLEYWSVDDLGNVEARHRLINIKLDKTAPTFVDWIKDPVNLTEDTTGFLRVSVRVMDAGGSGLTGKVPQFGYRLGRGAQYSEYENMMNGETDGVWYYDIPEPVETWNAHRGESLYYKVRMQDVAGNTGESREQEEAIDDINDLPTVSIITKFSKWNRGSLKVEAESSDTDGTITGVRFEYSFNKVAWTPIGEIITLPPYSVQWDTVSSVPEVRQTVWLKAITTDDDGDSTEYVIPSSISIDNQPPITTHDYDRLWHNRDFVIKLTASDIEGVGVAKISYRLNNGNVQDTPSPTTAGQAVASVNITTEGGKTALEYWSVDILGNEGIHETLTDIKLDKTAPGFSNWGKDPADLTEDTIGRFVVSVQVTDEGGSGLGGKIPQFDYHIGTDTRYEGYENMVSDDGIVWRFDIPEPSETWNAHRGEKVFYKVRVEDVANNIGESSEQEELIASVNDPPVVKVTSTFQEWEGGQILIEAEASDEDGSSPSVVFEYSTDSKNWTPIGVTSATPPNYSTSWDTKTAIPDVARTVWVRAAATDADDKSVVVVYTIPTSFGVDNQAPVFGEWTRTPEDVTEDTRGSIRVQVSIEDGIGSGVEKAELSYRIGTVLQRSFQDMQQESGNLWFMEIPEPAGKWDKYRGEILYYKARANDVVGNRGPDTPEQQELIEDINDPPRGLITSAYKTWERGDSLLIRASAIDDDGQIAKLQFQYSTNNVNWADIGAPLTTSPYTMIWNTMSIDADPDVWLRALITDDDNAVEPTPTVKLGIDNKPPVFSNWSHNNLTEDFDDIFRVEVEINDQGSGVDSSQVQIRYQIGKTGAYTEYQSMFRKTGAANVWFYEIPRPTGNWSNFAGETLTYMVRAADIAGNLSESAERSELIEPTTGSISGTVTPRESWFKGAKVSAQQNGMEVKQVSVSQINGSFSIKGLRPGVYDLVVTATGYGIDKSVTGVIVVAGKDSGGYNVELYTYTATDISRAQGGIVEFQDEALGSYKLAIASNTLEGKVVLGFSGSEPTSVPNPEVSLMGKAVGVGFKGRRIDKEMQLIVSRPVGISDGKSIMTFIYNGTDYRFVDRNDITQTAATITINLDPDDVQDFSDRNHNFTPTLSSSDTVFYVLITRFDEPQISAASLGIRVPGSTGSFTISTAAKRIALVIHGITTSPVSSSPLSALISQLSALTDNQQLVYYDHVLVFNYDPSKTITSNSNTFQAELNKYGLSSFTGKLDVVAHDMGGLIARRAIASGSDSRIGSLTMLGTPHDGVDDSLLKAGFTSFLKKTSSDPAWTYYRDGWQDILQGSLFLANLNSQSARKVNTHYYGIGADDVHDGLLYELSAIFLDNIRFPHLETPLTERFEPVSVSAPFIPGPGFMSDTKHVALVNSTIVIEKVKTYLLGVSSDIVYVRYEGEITPGETSSDFEVELENVGDDTVYDVSAELSTTDLHIQMIKNTEDFGNIPPGVARIGTFSFKVDPGAKDFIGDMITFDLTISNSRDNSISIERFEVPIGGNLIQIALDQSGNKRVEVDVEKDAFRPNNDGDIVAEPGEVMILDIALKNNSSSTFYTIIATLKTTDTRVVGLNTSGNEINMASTGISAQYGSLPGNVSTPQPQSFRFVKVKDDFTPLGDEIHFTLDIKSGGKPFGTDEFDVKVGAAIIVDRISVDEDLVPGGLARDIEVQLRNISEDNIDDVEVEIDWSPRVVTIPDERQDIGLMRSGSREDVGFSTSIDAGFAGYIEFTLEIRVDNDLINIETFSHYFGMRTQYATNWIVDDDNDNGIAEPGEAISLQIDRWNSTSQITRDVEVELSSADVDVISITEELGDYGDISAGESEESDDEFEFTVADAVNEDTGISTDLTATRLERSGANWIPDVFIGGTLNPNTTTGDPQYEFNIVDNGKDWIEVQTTASKPSMLDPDDDGVEPSDPKPGDPFRIAIDGNTFDLEGRTIGFTLDVTEDRELIGQETFTMRVGGKIRYVPPRGFDQLKSVISDSKGLGSLNNGNGIPEPGEIIEISITLINISDDNIDDVEAKLDEDERDVRVTDNRQFFGRLRRDGDTETKVYKFEIETDFEGRKIEFILEIDSELGYMGTDTFIIPVLRTTQ